MPTRFCDTHSRKKNGRRTAKKKRRPSGRGTGSGLRAKKETSHNRRRLRSTLPPTRQLFLRRRNGLSALSSLACCCSPFDSLCDDKILMTNPNLKANEILTFIPSVIDFQTAKSFSVEIGFEVDYEDGSLAILKK